jgi:hypothetical protein
MITFAIVPILALHISSVQQPAAPQGFQPYRVEAETDTVRIARVILAPGARVTTESRAGAVIVFLTADPDGRLPASEAAWQAPGSIQLENRGPARFEAVLVQFKTAPGASPQREYATAARGIWPAYAMGEYPSSYFDRIRSAALIDTPEVQVTRLRYPGTSYVEPPRVDAGDTVVVYLRGGYAWPVEPDYRGPARVHRGDARLIPANTPYALANPSSDASELIVVARR